MFFEGTLVMTKKLVVILFLPVGASCHFIKSSRSCNFCVDYETTCTLKKDSLNANYNKRFGVIKISYTAQINLSQRTSCFV